MIWLLERLLFLGAGYALGTYVKKTRARSTVSAGDEDWAKAWPADPKTRAVYLQQRAAQAAARAREAAWEASR